MSNITPFQSRNDRTVKGVLEFTEQCYREAGLSSKEITWALDEYRPYLEQFLNRERKSFDMQIPDSIGLSEEQVAVITDSKKWMQEVIDDYQTDIGEALQIIAGLIGSKWVR